jgi:glutaredoxin 3
MSKDELGIALYYYDACPFCQYVLRYLEEAGIEVDMKNTQTNPKNYEELIEIGGKRQVPCLVVQGQAMYESLIIVEWLKDYYPKHVKEN